MNEKQMTIGILGGMGTYATVHVFKQYADLFPAEKEWDRPRVIIDNRCTMPSRVRAYLYNENVEKLTYEMSESIQSLCNAGCTHIILACNTSHIFLPHVYERVPESEGKIINIIEKCADSIENARIKSIYLLGTEGTIDSKIYQNELTRRKIECLAPAKEEYSKLRQCIEAVKQNSYSKEVDDLFLELISESQKLGGCILGCTELPILQQRVQERLPNIKIFDPMYETLKTIREEFLNA